MIYPASCRIFFCLRIHELFYKVDTIAYTIFKLMQAHNYRVLKINTFAKGHKKTRFGCWPKRVNQNRFPMAKCYLETSILSIVVLSFELI